MSSCYFENSFDLLPARHSYTLKNFNKDVVCLHFILRLEQVNFSYR